MIGGSTGRSSLTGSVEMTLALFSPRFSGRPGDAPELLDHLRIARWLPPARSSGTGQATVRLQEPAATCVGAVAAAAWHQDRTEAQLQGLRQGAVAHRRAGGRISTMRPRSTFSPSATVFASSILSGTAVHRRKGQWSAVTSLVEVTQNQNTRFGGVLFEVTSGRSTGLTRAKLAGRGAARSLVPTAPRCRRLVWERRSTWPSRASS